MARKGENIYKRKDGRWEGRYIKSRSSTGKANYGYVYAKSYREVKAKLISQSSCTSNSVTVDPEISSDQFEQVAMEWFQAICPKVKESTSNKYRNLLSSYILPVFGSKQLRDITHEFIETQCNFFLSFFKSLRVSRGDFHSNGEKEQDIRPPMLRRERI